MPDLNAFSIMGFEPRPYVDLELLQQRFLELAAQRHPDQGGDAAEFGRLNSANQTLRDTSKRLRLLAELEEWLEPGKAPTEVPPIAAELFSPVQQAVSRTEACLRKAAEATSPLGKAILAKQILQVMEGCESAAALVREAVARLDAELQAIDREWPETKNREKFLPLIGGYAFTRKWLDQLQEKSFQVSQHLG